MGKRGLKRSVEGLTLPVGPGDIHALQNYDEFVISSMPSCRRRQAWDTVCNGMVMLSDFSGWDSWREGMQPTLDRLAKLMELPPPIASFVRSCDHGKLQQEALTWISLERTDGGMCLFSALDSRLPLAVQQWLQERRDEWDADPEHTADAVKSICQRMETGFSLRIKHAIV